MRFDSARKQNLPARLVLIAYAAVMLWLSLMPAGDQQQPPGLDKVLHLGAYAVFALIAAPAFSARYFTYACTGIFCFGLLMEILQGLTPSREMSAADQLANTAGILIGFMLVRSLRSSRG